MRFLTSKALIYLLVFDVAGLGSNFARMHKYVRRWKVSSQKAPPDATDQVCEAMNYACVWYPKRVLCLQRSAVTTCLLRDYGVSAQMVMGAQKLPFRAHAWTEVNGLVINERKDPKKLYGVWERC